MLFIKRYSIYGFVYLIAGLAVLFTHYLQTSAYNKAGLDEKITLVAASHFALSQLVDNMPGVFKENPHAAALKITDLRGSFLGAMYDSRRMTGTEYKAFLDTKLFDPQKEVLPGYQMHIWESKRRKLRIIAMSLKREQFSEYLAGMGRDYSLHYLIPLYILLGFAGLAGFHYFISGNALSLNLPGLKRPTQNRHTAIPGIRPVSSAKSIPKTTAHPWQLKSGVIAESTIQATLVKLRTMSGAATASLFAYEQNRQAKKWQGVAELRGALTVRGEAMDVPALLRTSAELTAEILTSPDRREWLFFNGTARAAQVCFALTFSGPDTAPGEDISRQISAFVKTNSRSLLVEHNYENSILDSESGLYSAPYAMFSLKEKMLAGKAFAVGIFRFSDADFFPAALPKTARTAIRLLRENFPAEEAPVIARGQATTIMVIFAAHRPGNEVQRKSAQQLFTAYMNSGKRVSAALIEDAAACGTPQRVLKIAERLLDESAQNGKLALYETQSHNNII